MDQCAFCSLRPLRQPTTRSLTSIRRKEGPANSAIAGSKEKEGIFCTLPVSRIAAKFINHVSAGCCTDGMPFVTNHRQLLPPILASSSFLSLFFPAHSASPFVTELLFLCLHKKEEVGEAVLSEYHPQLSDKRSNGTSAGKRVKE